MVYLWIIVIFLAPFGREKDLGYTFSSECRNQIFVVG